MQKNCFPIVHLPKEQWEGAVIPMRYTTEEYYDVKVEREERGYRVEFPKYRLDMPISHYPEEHDFPDKLYQPHWEKAYAWGIVEEKDGRPELLACIETCPEEWSNRLMVTELWVHEKLRRQGAAHALMAIAKEQAVLEHRRAIILETQSCNAGAISFYQKEGFELIGFDSCCYSNHDPERKEVRLDMGYFPEGRKKTAKGTVVIRKEEEPDFYRTEEMTLRAFWNKHHPGCNEHLLVHKLRDSRDYLPELSRVAVVGDEIVGAIFYSKALLKKDDKVKEILTFGPLCVAPKWQGCGIGGMLLDETLKAAKEAGYEGVVIFGEPDYYPLHGFVTCDHFGITTADGKNFDAFLGMELVEGALKAFGGRFYESDVFENLSEEENERFTELFDAPPKQKFPEQWD
ncbi:MAG: GNAT family N-acetyltransferase [Fusicatenibacter sp.]|nr:GNAT family N-acetyltransferase [Fusicatenibacter sp.]